MRTNPQCQKSGQRSCVDGGGAQAGVAWRDDDVAQVNLFDPDFDFSHGFPGVYVGQNLQNPIYFKHMHSILYHIYLEKII